MRQVYTSRAELRNSLDKPCARSSQPAGGWKPSGYEVEAPPGLMIQRFLRQADPKAALLRLSQAESAKGLRLLYARVVGAFAQLTQPLPVRT